MMISARFRECPYCGGKEFGKVVKVIEEDTHPVICYSRVRGGR